SWSRLNEILSYHQFPPENLRLLKNSQEVARDDYLELSSLPRRLNSAKITGILAGGATLILSHLDDLDPGVRNLAVSLERIFHTHVWINLYVGWGTERGFDLHWDTHHTIIVQLFGQKRWEVYNPTRTYPFRDDAEKTQPPRESPIWT